MLPPAATRPARIHQAMRYSMEAGGKRLRPVLLLASHAWLKGKNDATAAAVAIECIHTYSLIHDDLPSLDNSDLRRGHPTCHKAFDESTALLAGDALLTYAFLLLGTRYAAQPDIAQQLVSILARAAGSQELIGGQMEDILCETEPCTKERLAFIHTNKTAALLTASIQMGFVLANATAEQLIRAKQLGQHIGLSFQIVDDILDATSDAQTLGKPVAQDQQNNKATAVSLYGIDAAKQAVAKHTDAAIILCEKIGCDNGFMIDFIRYLENRIA